MLQQRLMTQERIRQCTFSARLDCHYLLSVPESMDWRTLLVLALHGYGATPEAMLRLTAGMFGEHHTIASLQGPYQFFTDGSARETGYGWITRRHAPSSIRLHQEMVLHVLNEVGREYNLPPERRILVGFSQSVGLNYRFVATHAGAVRGVAAICGGLPSDWEQGPYGKVDASVLHIARRGDEFYPPAVTEQYPERLKTRAADVEFHLMDGGHRFPSKGRAFAETWLERILA